VNRAAVYARVSTADQSVETQVSRLKALAGQLGLELPEDRVLVDAGVTGRSMERPQFDRVRELVQSRSADVVLVTKLDRLGRSTRGVLEFFDLAEANGVRVVCSDQAIDTATPVGRFTRTILAGVAELEADLTGIRTQDRLSYLRAKHRETGIWETRSGKAVGRPPRITIEVLSEIRRLRESDGLRWAQIALRVHAPATSCRKWYSVWKRAGSGPAGETGT